MCTSAYYLSYNQFIIDFKIRIPLWDTDGEYHSIFTYKEAHFRADSGYLFNKFLQDHTQAQDGRNAFMFKGEIIPNVNLMSEEAETHDSVKQKESIVHSTTATTVYRGSSINNNVHNYFSSHVSYAEWLHLCESISNSRKLDHFLLDTVDSRL